MTAAILGGSPRAIDLVRAETPRRHHDRVAGLGCQAIRDKYHGLINETTFNDELGDGVSLDQALADAMAKLGRTD